MESAPRTPERDDERYPDERHILPQPYVEVKTNETMKQLQPPAQPPVEATEKKKKTQTDSAESENNGESETPEFLWEESPEEKLNQKEKALPSDRSSTQSPASRPSRSGRVARGGSVAESMV